MSTFQLSLLAIFAFLGILAVLAFSGFIPIPGNTAQQFGGKVVIWGGLPRESVAQFFSDFDAENSASFNTTYVEKNPATLEQDLISALANGVGPDLIIMPDDLLLKEGDKLAVVPFTSFPLRTFKDSFIDEGELFLLPSGALALPLYVDPIVMYWNRDLFSSAALSLPPKVWEQFPSLPDKLTIRDTKGNITQSAVALGGVRNIEWSKDILSTLILQVGDPIVRLNADASVDAGLSADGQAASAVRFYTEFSNPSKTSYSWNSALLNSKTAFEAGTLAIYFGHASDLKSIKTRCNPHLNFDVALMPQRDTIPTKITFGRMYGVGVLRSSTNLQTAYTAAFTLTAAKSSAALAEIQSLPSADRSVLATRAKDPALDVFNRSAIISRGWLDPSPKDTDALFADMVESVIINKSTEEEAVSDASRRLGALLP